VAERKQELAWMLREVFQLALAAGVLGDDSMRTQHYMNMNRNLNMNRMNFAQ
jgi:hypothetical protein